jgi:hypothetical protein
MQQLSFECVIFRVKVALAHRHTMITDLVFLDNGGEHDGLSASRSAAPICSPSARARHGAAAFGPRPIRFCSHRSSGRQLGRRHRCRTHRRARIRIDGRAHGDDRSERPLTATTWAPIGRCPTSTPATASSFTGSTICLLHGIGSWPVGRPRSSCRASLVTRRTSSRAPARSTACRTGFGRT